MLRLLPSKPPPLPFNTVELLKTASKVLRLSPAQTMRHAEHLYLDGHLSYPRTETNKFPPSFDVEGALRQQAGDDRWGAYARRLLDDGAAIDSDRDYIDTGAVLIRWRDFRDECAMGIEFYNVTLLRLDDAGDSPLMSSEASAGDQAAKATWVEVNTTEVHRSVTAAHELRKKGGGPSQSQAYLQVGQRSWHHPVVFTRNTHAQNVHLKSKVLVQVTHQPRF